MTKIYKKHVKQQGFTLVEILVAMLVLAIGLLGVAALQLRGLQYSFDAHVRGQAASLANGIADRMRLREADAAAGSYNGNYTIPATAPTGCTQATASATNDLACWRLAAYRALPPGSLASITFDGTSEYTVTIQPFDRTQNALGDQITFSFVL